MSRGGNTRPLKIFTAAMGMIAFALMFTPAYAYAKSVTITMKTDIEAGNAIWYPVEPNSRDLNNLNGGDKVTFKLINQTTKGHTFKVVEENRPTTILVWPVSIDKANDDGSAKTQDVPQVTVKANTVYEYFCSLHSRVLMARGSHRGGKFITGP